MSRVYVHDTVFPLSQPGNCSASCQLSSPAPRHRQEPHTVTMPFMQLLLSADSLKVEHQHTLISYSHSDDLRETTHTQPSMGDNEPEPQSLSLQVRETARWARELPASCKGGSLEPGGQQGRRSPQSSRTGLQWPMPRKISMEQHSGVWGSALLAVVWSLPQFYLESGALHPSESF